MVFGNLQVDRTAQAVATDLGNDMLLTTFVGAGSMGGGLLLADWVANRALPMVGLPASPDSMLDLAGAVAVKTGTAGGAAFVAQELDGLPRVAAAFVALGSLASAGIDIVDVFTNLPALSGNRSSARISSSGARVKKVSSGGSGGSSGGNTSSASIDPSNF